MVRQPWLIPVVITAASLAPADVPAQFPTSPPPPTALREVRFPPFQETRLENRLDLLVVANHELPVASITLSIPAGSAYEPPGREGLAGFVAELLTKGTESRTAEMIAETIEGVGGSLNTSAGDDYLTVSATVLREHVPLAFELIRDVLLNATFPEEELELARKRFISALQAEKSDPGALARRYFLRELYGEHPYGRQPTEESVKAITRADIREYVQTRVRPGGSLLVVAGDIQLPDAQELTQRHLASWTGTAPAPRFPVPPPREPTSILLVHRPGSEQSNIRVGNLALRPGDERYHAAVIANRVLGGGSDARLFSILREEKSWTYGAYSGITRSRELGYFQANAEVRTTVTDSALTELLAQLRRIRTEAPADSELTAAKGYLVGSFPRQIETPQQIAGQVSTVKLLDLGDDYLQTYRSRLAAVTPEQAMRAAQAVVRPDSAVIVVVGDGQAIYEKLAAIAPVRIVDTDGEALTPDELTPRATALEIDPAQLVAGRDSFQVMFQGNAVGAYVRDLSRAGDELVYVELIDIPLAGMRQETTIRLDAASYAMRSLEQTGQAGGQPTTASLRYENGRVTGRAAIPQPGGTARVVEVDTTVAPGTMDDDALGALIPALPLAEGASFGVNVYSVDNQAMRVLTVKVTGVAEITVPAGTFRSYRVEVTGGETPLVMYVSHPTPRRVVQMEVVGQPVVFELVGR